MGDYRPEPGLRELINKKKSIFVSLAVMLLVAATGYFIYSQRSPVRSTGDKAFYTTDDGQSWFIDSIYRTPPFERDGKIAVRAMVYSYDGGSRRFCPFVEQYTPEMKKSLDDEVAHATQEQKPLSSITLFNSPEAM